MSTKLTQEQADEAKRRIVNVLDDALSSGGPFIHLPKEVGAIIDRMVEPEPDTCTGCVWIGSDVYCPRLRDKLGCWTPPPPDLKPQPTSEQIAAQRAKPDNPPHDSPERRNCLGPQSPIKWQPGWLAWERVLGICPVFYDNGALCVKGRSGLLYGMNADSLSLPTRQHLAVTIPGTEPPVQAWAMEEDDRVAVFYRNADNRPPTMAVMRERFEAEALRLNIVPASQVERHYKGEFPPKE